MSWPTPGLLAATNSADGLLGEAAAQTSDRIEVDGLKPLAPPTHERGTALPRSGGNPLWSVPLSALVATVERPIFSASRRPPQRVVGAVIDPVSLPPRIAAEPELPPMALLGAVTGENEAIAVFLDPRNQNVFRLRQGETFGSWRLSAVAGREVTLQKADRTRVLSLQGPAGGPAVAPAAAPGMVLPATGSGSYSPFIPRSSPKNGEPDGL